MKLCRVLRSLLLVVVMLACVAAAQADVWLPSSLTEIETQAFANARWLSGSCVIPDGTKTIGAQAFLNCSGMTSLSIPGSVTSIGAEAFAGCTGLTGSVTIPEGCNVAENAFAGCASLTVIYEQSDPSELFEWTISGGRAAITAFKGDKSVTSVHVPAMIDGCPVTAIDDYAFASSRYLTHVTLPAGVTTIGDYAFAYCSRLTGVTVPAGVSSLGRYAFYYCSSLTGTMELLDATIPSNAFTGCKNLSVLAYSANADGTLTLARYYGSQKSVTVPNRAFGCRVTAIGREAFSYRTALESVSLPRGITTIGQSAFYYCSALTGIQLPYGVTSVGPSAFHSCSALTTATLPESISSIGSMAFHGCTSLNARYELMDVAVDASAFSSCSGVEVWCYTQTGENTVRLTSCISGSSDIVIQPYMQDFVVTGMSARAFAGCRNLQHITLPETFTQIPAEAFYKCTTLTRVTIPAGVETIGTEAFYGCTALQSVTLPGSVAIVGSHAFDKCTALTTLAIGSEDTELLSYAFAGCSSLASVTLPGTGENVGDMAFNGTPWLNNRVAAVALRVTQGCTTPYEKALALHDWLIENTAYDLSYTFYGSEGVLFHGLGVCNAYTLTYSRLLNAVGISSMTVTGTATDKSSGNSGSHAWTLVQLDGSWYHVDTTWDDPIPDGRERHTYFCLTDAEMAADHTWNRSAYPAANGSTYSLATTERAADATPSAQPETSNDEESLCTTTRNKRR